MSHFPDLYQATIDNATLTELFRDIAALGMDVEVIPKQNAREQVGVASMTLTEAYTALREQSIRATQVRYTHAGQRWCDTIAPSDNGWRLIRINLSEAATV
ncbi:hypothetical protein [Aeoliella sp. SH292]|uniref:hypothetical protein n=1 Tax=Aeoliella sp. SH292 TaxID=3454464 RepID=UPI003F9D1D9F